MRSFAKYLSERIKLTLQYHEELNPAIWQDDKLKAEINKVIVEKAAEFAKFSGIPHESIVDIIITGSNCNYNYTHFSDVDCHLVVRIHGMDSDRLYDRKVEWTLKHKRLKAAGYPLEFYAQDSSEKLPSDQGQWSLAQNKWLVHPQQIDHSILKDPAFKKKVEFYIRFIKQLLADKNEAGIRDLKKKFYEMRSAGLARAGEFSYENSLYKELRNRGLVDKLNKAIHQK